MNILFVHQNMPGQYKHLAPALARNPKNKVFFLTQRKDAMLPRVTRATYPPPRAVNPGTHPYLRSTERALLHGQQVAGALVDLKRQGFVPDLVVGHPGWGELLFVPDVYPDVPIVSYAEFYYRGVGADVGVDPEEELPGGELETRCRVRVRAGHLLQSLDSATVAISPTQWQKSVHPEAYHSKIEVIFDGIDTRIATPEGRAELTLPGGLHVRKGDEVVTYVARNLEPHRGFRPFMRAVPEILARRPNARIVVVGDDAVSYGRKPKNHDTWRQAMMEEVQFDETRVHFVGRLAYDDFLTLMRVSSAHIYLTYPFVLSWSCLEAMACGAVVIGSDTPPVREVIRGGENGLLTDLFDHHALAVRVTEVLADPRAYEPLRLAARETIAEHYALDRVLPLQLALLDRVTDGRLFRGRNDAA